MKYKWLNKKDNKSLIVFFNGWGMDESVVSHLGTENYDLVMFYDYNTLKTDFDFELFNKYSKKHLVAWSMGVMTATLFDIKYTSSTAINGTLKPIDNKFGIPEKIFDITLSRLSPDGVQKFITNMFDDAVEFPPVNRSFENQKAELAALKTYKSNENFRYTKILISDNDKIIPTKNQVAFWKIEPNVKSGHALFKKYNFWSELL